MACLVVGIGSGMAGFSLGYKRAYKQQFPGSPLPIHLFKAGSLVCLIACIGSIIYSSYFLSNSLQTTAVITEIVEHTDSEGAKTFNSLYTYKDHLGQTHTSSSNFGDGREFPTGHKINIRYIESNPYRSQIDTFAAAWFLPIFSAFASLIAWMISKAFKIKLDHESRITSQTSLNNQV